MSEGTKQPEKKPKVRKVFGRVRFTVKQPGSDVPEIFTATMDRQGVTIRRLHSQRPQLLTFDKILDAIAGQYTFRM